jgi:hypothetical protein
VGWAGAVLFCAAIMLACVNARSISTWLSLQPPTSRLARLQPAAQAWWLRTAAWGLDAPRAAVAAAWDQVRHARWPGAHGRE